MTDQLTDNFGKKEPRELWQEMRRTKYTDADIRAIINSAKQYSGTDYADEQYAQSAALTAQAMIAYNEMIDARIERAQRSWGMK